MVRHQFIPALGREISLAEIGRAMDREEARELGVSSHVAHNNVRNDGFFSLQARFNAPHSAAQCCAHGSHEAIMCMRMRMP